MRCGEFGCFYYFLKLDLGKALNNDTPVEKDASSSDNNLGLIRNREIACTVQSEQQSIDIDELEKVEENPDDPHSRSNEENDQEAEILPLRDQVNLCHYLLKQKRKIIKNGAGSERKRRKTISLRRNVLLAQTKKIYLSLTAMSSELSQEGNKPQSEFKDLQDKKSRIANKGDEEIGNDSPGTLATTSSSLNKSRLQPTSPNQLKKEIVNKNPVFYSEKSTSAPTISNIKDTNSKSTKSRPGKEVWEHFKWFLQSHKESFDRVMRDCISRDNLEVTSYVNPCLKESAEAEKSTTGDFNPLSVTKLLQYLRFYAMKKLKGEESLMTRKMSDQVEKMKCSLTKDLKAKRLGYYNFLCDYECLFRLMKRQKTFANMPNLTNLTDLPLSAAHILTFYSLFLYLHKSLSPEVPMEIILKRINSENCVLAYRKYREQKSIQVNRIKMSEKVSVNIVGLFNISLKEYGLDMKSKIPHSENMSLEAYQSYIKNLMIAIKENLNCLKEILFEGYCAVSQVQMYLNESRKSPILNFIFLDNKRPDVFTNLS